MSIQLRIFFTFVLAFGLLVFESSCSKGNQCGPGTVLKENLCVPKKAGEGSQGESSSGGEKSKVEFGQKDASTTLEKKMVVEHQKEQGLIEQEPIEQGTLTGSKVGESCGGKTACLKGLTCLRDGYCTKQGCKEKADCPTGMTCREVNHQGKDGKWKTFTACVRPAPKEKKCVRDKDCPSSQSCFVGISPSGDAIVKVCARSIPKGKQAGEACSSKKNIQCRNQLCLNDSFCSALCKDKVDCPKDFSCERVEFSFSDGKKAKIQACVPVQKSCERDKDCPVGTVCQFFAKKDQSGINKICTPINAKGAGPGLACNPKQNSKNICYNNLCIDAGFCFTLCKEAKDCKKGFTCITAESQLPNGKKFSFKGCAPKGDPCKRNADCSKEMVCILGINQAGDKIVPFCGVRRLDSLTFGQSCKPGSTNPNEQCANNMCLSQNYCSAVCDTDKDCGAKYTCAELEVELKNKKRAKFKGCIKK